MMKLVVQTNIITYTTNLEYAGDIIEKHILDMVGKKIQSNIVFSNAGWREIESIHVALMETNAIVYIGI